MAKVSKGISMGSTTLTKEENHMITPVDVEKAFDKSQNLNVIKSLRT